MSSELTKRLSLLSAGIAIGASGLFGVQKFQDNAELHRKANNPFILLQKGKLTNEKLKEIESNVSIETKRRKEVEIYFNNYTNENPIFFRKLPENFDVITIRTLYQDKIVNNNLVMNNYSTVELFMDRKTTENEIEAKNIIGLRISNPNEASYYHPYQGHWGGSSTPNLEAQLDAAKIIEDVVPAAKKFRAAQIKKNDGLTY